MTAPGEPAGWEPEYSGGFDLWVILLLKCRRCRRIRARLVLGHLGSIERWWISVGRQCRCPGVEPPDPEALDSRISREWRRGRYPTLIDTEVSRAPFTVWI